MRGICAVGELLIDFTPCGRSAQGQQLFARNPGGAPANVLAMAAKFGVATRLCAVVGQDAFGTFLKKSIREAGVDDRFVRGTPQACTTLAFVELDERNDRTFTFCRKPGADLLLDDDAVPDEALAGCSVFHFSGVSLTGQPARGAVLRAAQRAKRMGMTVSFDPNYRAPLWDDAEETKQCFQAGMELADLIKLSQEEVALVLDGAQPRQGAVELAGRYQALVLVSLGASGALAAGPQGYLASAGAPQVTVRDTTGAGDAFLGSILADCAGRGWTPQAIDPEAAKTLLRLGCAAGSLTAAGLGAIAAQPTKEQIARQLARERQDAAG